jgi:hypothetical protein
MVDWSPFGGDPVPGDPDQVRVLAGGFHSFADDVDTQNALLKALRSDSTGVWEGPAADAFRPHLEDLPPKLDKLVSSYREAGDALSVYAPRLASAQAEAVAALQKATEALTRLGRAQAEKSAQDAANRTAAAAAPPGHPAATVAQPDYGAAVSQAQADLNAAHRAKDGAVDDARAAARHCIDALKQATNDGIKNKHHHWWDTVVDVVTHPTKLLKVISQVANTLSAICGILALVTCWIPGVGEAFAAAALVTGAIGLVADALLAATGSGGWGAVGLDAVGLVPFGADKALGVFAKAGEAAERTESAATGVSRVVAEGGSAAGHEASDGGSIALRYKEGWSDVQKAAADDKVGKLDAAANDGRLHVTKVERSGTSASSRYRKSGGLVPTGSDVDHTLDLQLGGEDDVGNMSPLDLSVNRSLGPQIMHQVKNFPVGTRIVRVSIGPR